MACRIKVSAPVPVPFPWTLDLGFGTWIWDLNLGLGFGTWIWDLYLGLDLGLTTSTTTTSVLAPKGVILKIMMRNIVDSPLTITRTLRDTLGTL